MNSWAKRIAQSTALLLVSGLFLAAQDWKTAATLPGIDLSKLAPAQKATVLKVLREEGCSCECGMKLAQCRIVDPNCAYSKGMAEALIEAVAAGKTEPQAIQTMSESKWAHLQEQPGGETKILSDPVQISLSGDPTAGPKDAPLTIVEFSDFQCPYCVLAVPEIKGLLKEYPTQVKLVFKQFPLEMHPQADLAAAAAVAAQRQGKFWEMHDALFGSQHDLSRKNILQLAKQNGIDVKRFEEDLDSSSVHESVVRDVQDGDKAGVQGTPTLFLNGQRYNGAISLAQLRPLIAAEIKANTGTAHVASPAGARD